MRKAAPYRARPPASPHPSSTTPFSRLLLDLLGCRVGDGSAASQKPYKGWIGTYADEGFGEAVRTVIATTDRAADAAAPATRAKMLAAFIRACHYEWLFWDGAYQRRGWPQFG